MWIKNLTVFLGSEAFPWSQSALQAMLAKALCPACGAQTLSTEGFVPPIKGDDAMVHAVDGMVYCVYQETGRLLPGAVVKEEVDARAEQIEAAQGRKPGRKERADLKDQVIFELLPKAFTRSRQTGVMIDLRFKRVLVDSASEKRAEQVVTALRKAVETLPVVRPSSAASPAALMSEWLRDPKKLPPGFELGDRCELQGAGDERASVRCAAVDLQTDEILAHLDAGMQVARLNLSWNDELELDLTESLDVKRIRPLDQIRENIEALDSEGAVAELQARLSVQGAAVRALLDTLYGYFEVTATASAEAA